MAKVITIGNSKGGVGKTTTAINLSSELSTKKNEVNEKNKVLLVDLDPQCNNSKYSLKIGPGEYPSGVTMADVIDEYIQTTKKKNIIDQCVRFSKDTGLPYDIAPCHPKLEGLKTEIVSKAYRYVLEILQGIFAGTVDDYYDYIVIDCPPDMNILVENAIAIADLVLCVSTYDEWGMDGLFQIIPLIKELRGEDFNNYKVLFTQFQQNATGLTSDMGEYLGFLNEFDCVIPQKIPFTVKFKRAIAHKEDVMTQSANFNGKASYQLATNWIVNYMNPV